MRFGIKLGKNYNPIIEKTMNMINGETYERDQ